jgi:non-ribosomal peptide synthetase component E (peptide arylation enzyme)
MQISGKYRTVAAQDVHALMLLHATVALAAAYALATEHTGAREYI